MGPNSLVHLITRKRISEGRRDISHDAQRSVLRKGGPYSLNDVQEYVWLETLARKTMHSGPGEYLHYGRKDIQERLFSSLTFLLCAHLIRHNGLYKQECSYEDALGKDKIKI